MRMPLRQAGDLRRLTGSAFLRIHLRKAIVAVFRKTGSGHCLVKQAAAWHRLTDADIYLTISYQAGLSYEF